MIALAYAARDGRDLANARVIGNFAYSDQVYCVERSATEWLCVATISLSGGEGGSGETVVSTTTADAGISWTDPVRLEAPLYDGLVAYGVPALVRPPGLNGSERVYVLFNMNSDNVTKLPDGTPLARKDELGHFKLRWSDDWGRSWGGEARRLEVPFTLTPVDTHNSFAGATKEMWTVDRPTLTADGRFVMAFTKIGTYVQSPPEEVFILSSPNLASEAEPAAVSWELHPGGADAHGITNPRSAASGVCEEGHIQALRSADAAAFVTWFRTADGYLGEARSADGGRSWSESRWATYCGTERPVKHNRGPLTPRLVERLGGAEDSFHLLLYYNNGQQWHGSYRNRNPYFLAAGQPLGGGVCWSQPEIVLFNPSQDEFLEGAGGYADFVHVPPSERLFIALTNKSAAFTLPVAPELIAGLRGQLNHTAAVATDGLALTLHGGAAGLRNATALAPPLPDFGASNRTGLARQGMTLELWLAAGAGSLLNTSGAAGAGVALTAAADSDATRLRVGLADGAGVA
jgi:hypothetical protein